MEQYFILKDRVFLILLLLCIVLSFLLGLLVGFLRTRNTYRGKVISFLDFFKKGDLFVLDSIICEGRSADDSVFGFKKVKRFLGTKIVFGRTYHVRGYEGSLSFNEKSGSFEKNTIYKVKEIWRDPGRVVHWYFDFEIPALYSTLNNPSLA